MILSDKRIVLGVTGSIAAYKAVYLASALTRFDARVDTVMTSAAARFIGSVSFEGLTGRPAYTSVMQSTPEGNIAHVALGSAAEAIVIAPATAGTIARLAAGMASDILTASVLSSAAPVIIAPAMESEMYLSAVTRENLKTLESRGGYHRRAGNRPFRQRPGGTGADGRTRTNYRHSARSPRQGTDRSPAERSSSPAAAPGGGSIRFVLSAIHRRGIRE